MSDKYPISSNIPIPPRGSEKYPWRKMKIGDSFPIKPEEYAKVCYAAAMAAKRHGYKFRISKGQLRVWRME
jgi:hypothetical protein